MKTAQRPRPNEWELAGDKLVRRPNLAVNAKDGTILVRIPAGEFEMGDGKHGDCPKHQIELSDYWIGVYCVTNRQYGRFVAETKHRAPDNQKWQKPELSDHPVTDVSWDESLPPSHNRTLQGRAGRPPKERMKYEG
jgi:formylglycine-generating enzyme required for sulfatase activity